MRISGNAMNKRKLLLILWLAAMSQELHAGRVQVAVASNFAGPMRDIAAEFSESFAHRVTLSSGSSGKFFAQIMNGAPFEVFFSADQEKPQALEKAGLVVPGSRMTYAIGTLVLWSLHLRNENDNRERLENGDFRRLALANPKLAPYGAAAVEVLENLGLAEKSRTSWVRGENIAQTYQFVSTGSADMGFVSLSQIMVEGHPAKGSAWIVPGHLHEPIRQDAVLLRVGRSNVAAQDLLRYIQGERAREIIAAHGYQVPSAEP